MKLNIPAIRIPDPKEVDILRSAVLDNIDAVLADEDEFARMVSAYICLPPVISPVISPASSPEAVA